MRIFGCAEDTPARQCSNKFDIALAYSYLCYGINLRRGRFGSEAGEILPDLKDSENMSMVFKFRMLSDENDNFVRDYEAMYDMTLLDFHDFILQSLDYEPCMASFFTADDRWEKQREFTSVEMDDGSGDAPAAMESVTLGQVIHNRRDRLIYLFDIFGDRAYFLELTGTFEAEKGASYPREIYAQAAAPDQYDPSKTRAEDDDGSIFGEVMSEFSDFEGDDNYDDEY